MLLFYRGIAVYTGATTTGTTTVVTATTTEAAFLDSIYFEY